VHPLSHLTYCTATEFNLYLSNSPGCPIQAPSIPSTKSALYRLPAFQVPNFMSPFRCLIRTKVLFQARGKCSCFVTKPKFIENLSTAPPTPKLGDQPLSALPGGLFNVFAVTHHIGGCFHLAINLKFVTSKILFQPWMPMTVSRKIISLI
jgi:hypothetical protein